MRTFRCWQSRGGDEADDASCLFGTAVVPGNQLRCVVRNAHAGWRHRRGAAADGMGRSASWSRRSGVIDHHGVRPEARQPTSAPARSQTSTLGSGVMSCAAHQISEPSGSPLYLRVVGGRGRPPVAVRVGVGFDVHVGGQTRDPIGQAAGCGGEPFGVEPVLVGVAGCDRLDAVVPGVDVGVAVDRMS